MNSNPLLLKEIGTRRDNQYRAGEKELIKIINKKNLISQYNPFTTNLDSFFKFEKENLVFSLN